MQKLINVLATISFVGVAGIFGAGTYVYLNRDAITDKIKESAKEAILGSLGGGLGGLMQSPDLPSAPLPELPVGSNDLPSPSVGSIAPVGAPAGF
tara:strand:- start:2329 stop:2613 length:285 start_codon:yes stop_codon:yes gene_type:complete